MDKHGSFVARLLDSGLRVFAHEVASRQRRILGESGVELPVESFPALVGDTEARIVVLAEALAIGVPALFVEQIEWTRSAYLARGVSEEGLALNLICIREVLLRELPSGAHDAVRVVLDRANRSFEEPPRVAETVLAPNARHTARVRRILLAMLEGDSAGALRQLVAPLEEGLTVSEIEMQIVCPLQAEIGLMWQRGELHIHEEHLSSQIVGEALVLLRSKLPRAAPREKSVLVSSVAGNLHDIGARIVADHFELDGWRTVRLGANVPGEDLARAVVDFEPDLLALSVTLISQLRSTAAIIEDVRGFSEGACPPILVGGAPFARVPDLWSALGADGCAESAPEAVLEGRRMLRIG